MEEPTWTDEQQVNTKSNFPGPERSLEPPAVTVMFVTRSYVVMHGGVSWVVRTTYTHAYNDAAGIV